jgi:hypothetical protein
LTLALGGVAATLASGPIAVGSQLDLNISLIVVQLTGYLVAHIEIALRTCIVEDHRSFSRCVVGLSGDEESKSREDSSMDASRLLILTVNFGRTF